MISPQLPLSYDFVATLAESGQEHLAAHCSAVRDLAIAWGTELQLPELELEKFGRAAHLHDVGKLVLPTSLLLKEERLTPGELAMIREHVTIGVRLLEGYVSPEIVQIVGQHHERMDGRGYPFGIRGEQIHPLARRLSIVDAYVAMVEGRTYLPVRSKNDALLELQRCADTQFDAECVNAFVRWYRV